MKNRKLRLHRETIRHLDPARLSYAVGAAPTEQPTVCICATSSLCDTNVDCPTGGQYTCDCGTLEAQCNSIDLCQPGSEGCTRPRNICTSEMGTCQG